jgi:hypothetical protein
VLSISKLWSAMARLAGEVEALATTTAEINQGLRSRLHLDGPEGHVETLGHIVEDGGNEEVPAARGGRGRRKATAG